MIQINWKYEDEPYHCVDYDRDYYNGKLIDIGWDYWTTTVHGWTSSLNKAASEIFQKIGARVNILKMNQASFDLVQLGSHDYYRSGKLGHYTIEVTPEIPDNKIFICNIETLGCINIIK